MSTHCCRRDGGTAARPWICLIRCNEEAERFEKCRRFRQMSNCVSKRSTLHLRSSRRRSVVIFEICLIRYGEGAESVGRNVEISTPVDLHTLRRSTIHFAQSPVPVAQPSFAQVLDSVARTNATLASQMPVLNAKAVRVAGPS